MPSSSRVFHYEVDQMHSRVLNKQTDECPTVFSLRESAENSRISVCHLSAGGGWSGGDVQVVAELRALSQCPEIALHAIILQEGRLAHELRSVGIDVQVASEQQKSFPQILSECSRFV